MSITKAIQQLKHEMNENGIIQEKGLGTELFHFASTLMPVINVDLIVTDQTGKILLSWREDEHTGIGWHVPGRCIRFQETLEDAIQRCALSELGSKVKHSEKPVTIYEFFSEPYNRMISDKRERAHFIALVYACSVPCDFEIK